MIRDNIPASIRGAAALAEMLDCIGAMGPDGNPIRDTAVAKLLVDNEMPLRELLKFSLDELASR